MGGEGAVKDWTRVKVWSLPWHLHVTVILTSSFQKRNWERKLVLKPRGTQVASIWWLLRQFFGPSPTECYGMKMADFQLPVQLLPCLQINNSNVAFALFASALKLKLLPCQSRLKNKTLIKPSRMNKQRNEPCNALNLQKRHGYSYFLISRKKLRKKLVLKTPDAQISS